ncbi:hypothetical protein LTR36_002417 [Oleoguttula mirabilis]|uniref:Threonyl/alanyl tRNA synthetase SAD domain-containing protein n=1 Tax=Oleoguttula mirabilis TaxID=1507867 RepID=A0AAV9JLK6_9PEZI|nr:hypothetical protein LTR36_002417 [Oleoguttula mirabilis]
MAPTKPLYQSEESLRQLLTRINTVWPWSGLDEGERGLYKAGGDGTYVLETHETIFYAQGGGQPFDTGYMSVAGEGQKEARFDVQAVRNGAEGRVLHYGRFADGSDNTAFAEGIMVEQHIDGARRDLNSRIHTAGHIVGLAVCRLATQTPELQATDGVKAQHYPDISFVEFNGLIDGKWKEAIQRQCTEFVEQALPVRLSWLKPEELGEHEEVILVEGMPIITGPDGKVRIVDIVGAGAYACGGTHVPDTSFVGELVVKGIKRQKGISKVSYAIKDKA